MSGVEIPITENGEESTRPGVACRQKGRSMVPVVAPHSPIPIQKAAGVLVPPRAPGTSRHSWPRISAARRTACASAAQLPPGGRGLNLGNRRTPSALCRSLAFRATAASARYTSRQPSAPAERRNGSARARPGGIARR